jgi:hypothetical protein
VPAALGTNHILSPADGGAKDPTEMRRSVFGHSWPQLTGTNHILSLAVGGAKDPTEMRLAVLRGTFQAFAEASRTTSDATDPVEAGPAPVLGHR